MKKGQFCRAAVFGMALVAGPQASAITLYEIQKVGFYDLEHRYSNLFWSNQFGYFNSAGQVVGTSIRYFGGTTYLGQDAWIHSGGVTQRIGLTDAGHTSSDGWHVNTVRALSNAGHVIGQANRYDGSADAGQSAWIYDGNSTQEIGLAGSEHTYTGSGTAYIQNYAGLVNDAGNAVGSAYRYNGSTSIGYSAWLYSGGTTQKIGLTSGAHTRADGYQDNVVRKLNNAGQVVGHAARYISSSQFQYGQSVWPPEAPPRKSDLPASDLPPAPAASGTTSRSSTTRGRLPGARSAIARVAGPLPGFTTATRLIKSAWSVPSTRMRTAIRRTV